MDTNGRKTKDRWYVVFHPSFRLSSHPPWYFSRSCKSFRLFIFSLVPKVSLEENRPVFLAMPHADDFSCIMRQYLQDSRQYPSQHTQLSGLCIPDQTLQDATIDHLQELGDTLPQITILSVSLSLVHSHTLQLKILFHDLQYQLDRHRFEYRIPTRISSPAMVAKQSYTIPG